MAVANHYKINRKALREPDEFQTLTSQALDWYRDNQTLVVGALAAVVAVGAVVIGMNWYSQRQADAAAVQLQAAEGLFEAKKYSEAAAGFAAVATEHARTPSGRIAAFYRGHALAAQQDHAAAATAYTEYLASSPPTEYLKQEALIGLAHAHEAAGNAEGARDAYRQAADLVGPFRAQAQVGLGRLEDSAGRRDQANSLYAEALKDPHLDADTRQMLAARVPDAAKATEDAEAAPTAAAE